MNNLHVAYVWTRDIATDAYLALKDHEGGHEWGHSCRECHPLRQAFREAERINKAVVRAEDEFLRSAGF